jgi:hypothetical protein
MSKKWEYCIVDSHEVPGVNFTDKRSKQDIADYLNRLGQEGWEIINLDMTENQVFYNFFGVAKRELTS